MKKNRIIVILIAALMLLGSFQLSAARPEGIAFGAQGGFLATGVVVDIPLGKLGVNAGVNYPLGWTWIATLAGGATDVDMLFPAFFTVTADVTTRIELSEDFSLKVGASGIALTDFEMGFAGVVGACLKAEYWIPNKDTGLFVNLNVPVMAFLLLEGQTPGTIFSPWLTLAGLLTTTAGVLWTL